MPGVLAKAAPRASLASAGGLSLLRSLRSRRRVMRRAAPRDSSSRRRSPTSCAAMRRAAWAGRRCAPLNRAAPRSVFGGAARRGPPLRGGLARPLLAALVAPDVRALARSSSSCARTLVWSWPTPESVFTERHRTAPGADRALTPLSMASFRAPPAAHARRRLRSASTAATTPRALRPRRASRRTPRVPRAPPAGGVAPSATR